MTKSGFKTSEFWAAAASQLLALLALFGLVGRSDLPTLQDAVEKCVAAIALFAANAWVVVHYIRSRTLLKQLPAPPR